MDKAFKFAEILEELIFEQKMDAKTFAEKIGVSPTCITRYLREDRFPSVEYLVQIADYFNCSTDYLLGFEEEKGNPPFKKCPEFFKQFSYLLEYFNYNCLRLSKDLKFHQSSVYAWKNGKRVPTVENIVKLADYFDCRVDFILGRES